MGHSLTGDLNITTVYPGAILGWHRHQWQDDLMVVASGVLKVCCWQDVETEIEGMADREVIWKVLDARQPERYLIPAGWWHGYTPIGGEAVVVTYITRHYNPADEARMDITLTPDIVWTTRPR